MANRLHYLALAGAIALGAILRFWHLDSKFLWLDEVITAIFSLGRNYHDVPLDTIFPLARLEQIFTFQSASCSQIAQNLANQSTHPPLFFCLMHSWFEWINPVAPNWVWTLRALSAVFGTIAIAAIYFLNTKAFSPTAGLMAAVMMAVSPFGVYLSQEARHYTLPVLAITLSLLGLIQIQHDLFVRRRSRFGVWLFWAIVNSIGLYIHYFFILALVSEVITLLALMYWYRHNLPRHSIFAFCLAMLATLVIFLPWLPTMIAHFTRPETSWIPTPHNVAPIYQTMASWLLMIIALPVENQPLYIVILSSLLLVIFGGLVMWHSYQGINKLWQLPANRLSVFTLASFTGIVLLEFFSIVYILQKDITIVPRYNFVYYPSFIALLAAGLISRYQQSKLFIFNISVRRKFYFLLFISSLISCILVIFNFVFQKPYNPEQVATNINQEPTIPLMVVVGYKDYQDVALGLSFALALEKVRDFGRAEFAFLERSPQGYNSVWQKLAQLPPINVSRLNLWVVAPGLRRREYPPNLQIGQTSCNIDLPQHYRIGVPYQLYRCRR
jgi:uncharacterized membrane protein